MTTQTQAKASPDLYTVADNGGKINIAPLTLVFGLNGTGKSELLRRLRREMRPCGGVPLSARLGEAVKDYLSGKVELPPMNRRDEWLWEAVKGSALELHLKHLEKDGQLRLVNSMGDRPLFPLLTECIETEGVIFSEHPDAFLHPKVQVDLGDFLIGQVQKVAGRRFVIETHSEHLMLRLQRRVRDKTLAPESVSFIHVRRPDKEGPSVVRHLRLGDDGDFVDDWPGQGGCFAERLAEIT